MQRPVLLAALLALVPAAGAMAQTSGPIMVSDAWSRPAAQGTNAVGYMVLMNHGQHPAALIKVESPLARKVEIHRSSAAGGVMSMNAQPRIDIPPAGMVAFAPGGYHLMFFGVSKPLRPGDKLPAALSFSGGRRIEVNFQVGSGAGPPPAAHPGH